MGHLVYVLVKLVFGTLYPAYYSFKAVKTKNVKEYVHWMTYWIVFALITLTEEVSDLFLSFWFPFYYECKILLLVWLLSPATRGSFFLYRQVIHPTLNNREEEIDDFVKRWKEQSLKYTRACAQKMTTAVIETALAGGGGLVRTLRHSCSLTDLRGVQHAPEDTLGQVEGQEELGGRVVPRYGYEDSGYGYGTYWKERRNSGRIKTSSLYGTLPRSGAGSGTGTRPGSQYGTLPRRTRKQRPAIPDFAPLGRKSAQSKESLEKDGDGQENLSSLQRQNSTLSGRGQVRTKKQNQSKNQLY
eukprot:GFUD01037336.1.p1 GENE.GFUD01037336.1~~GFUD01037336.1.p1  ORF type:complete len:300 (+),score=77.95 GFUD01037336.1:202-1101(+)